MTSLAPTLARQAPADNDNSQEGLAYRPPVLVAVREATKVPIGPVEIIILLVTILLIFGLPLLIGYILWRLFPTKRRT